LKIKKKILTADATRTATTMKDL